MQLPNPHPECSVDGDLKINSASASGTKLTEIAQTVMLNPSYSCADNEFTQVLNNAEFYNTELPSPFEGAGQSYAVQSTPNEYTDVVWDNLPLNITSEVNVQTRYEGVEGAEWASAKVLNAHKNYQPDCVYHVNTPTFSANLADANSVWGEHKLNLNSAVSGEFGYYCPGFTSEVTYFYNDAKMMSVSLTADQTGTFFKDGTEYTGESIKKTDSIEFAEGNYCIQFSMTPTKAAAGQIPETKTSERICQNVVAPACEITPHTDFIGTLNDASQTMTYVNKASY